MRIRAIASVGVMLCIAVTSLSIYLGIVEHVYLPTTTHQILVFESSKQRLVCNAVASTQLTADRSAATVTHRIEDCKSVTG